MTKIETLILRNCSINGTIPEYLGKMASLETLDLSFNKLTGNVSSSLASLSHLKYIFLTGNLLSGEVEDSLLKSKKSTDLSYNNFTDKTSSCQQGSVNLFASSSQGNNSRIVSCLRSFPCPKRNSSTLTVANPKLYMNARLSPISLTYYAFCLVNGSYTVKLHFAEIMFTNDKKYSSLGRRLFDVYIQVASQNIFKQITDIVKCAIIDNCIAGKASAAGFQHRG
ncbi:hypothetical protein TIFTF001_054684 [Ficus carica]|uniref:non-specific serine/threonine protein kinase n=1 Tax=Ficus carica TaxID=3494 RepID=A0AA88EDV8_FICCA|nr:hypothetical protein TIFTF001_054684 [Ficus carica]